MSIRLVVLVLISSIVEMRRHHCADEDGTVGGSSLYNACVVSGSGIGISAPVSSAQLVPITEVCLPLMVF